MIGPTGEYPLGTMRPDDKGGLNAGFAISQSQRLVAMKFGTMVAWIGVPVAQALDYAKLFRKRIAESFGDLPYDASTLPFRIETDPKKGVIITHFPVETEMIVANPECFLGWAERLESAAKEILI